MKSTLLNYIFIPVSAIALTGSMTALSNNKNENANTDKQEDASTTAAIKT